MRLLYGFGAGTASSQPPDRKPSMRLSRDDLVPIGTWQARHALWVHSGDMGDRLGPKGSSIG